MLLCPPRWSVGKQANLGFELKKLLSWKKLGKSINNLIFRGNMSKKKGTILNLISNKMKILSEKNGLKQS